MTLLQAYLHSPKARRALSKRPGDAGFSLIELVVVVAILAILAAVALPNFLGVSKDAQVAAAKNTLATVIKECATKDAQGGGGVIGGTGNQNNQTGKQFNPITSLGSKLNGYTFTQAPAADALANAGPGTNAIVLNSTPFNVSCYSVAAISDNGTLFNYSISMNPTTGIVTKSCAGAATAYGVGCNSNNTWE